MVTPRPHAERGGHVALAHPDARRLSLSLRARGVVPDYRAPDVLRLAPVALYTTDDEVLSLVRILREVLDHPERVEAGDPALATLRASVRRLAHLRTRHAEDRYRSASHQVSTQPGERNMADDKLLANQKTIIENQKKVFANQKKIEANQKTIAGNQKKLDQVLANQKRIATNQARMEENQKKILENQRKILAK